VDEVFARASWERWALLVLKLLRQGKFRFADIRYFPTLAASSDHLDLQPISDPVIQHLGSRKAPAEDIHSQTSTSTSPLPPPFQSSCAAVLPPTTVDNGPSLPPRSAKTGLPGPNRLAAHVLDFHELIGCPLRSARPATSSCRCAQSHSPAIITHCRFPCHQKASHSASSASGREGHRERPRSCPAAIARPWWVPLDV